MLKRTFIALSACLLAMVCFPPIIANADPVFIPTISLTLTSPALIIMLIVLVVVISAALILVFRKSDKKGGRRK